MLALLFFFLALPLSLSCEVVYEITESQLNQLERNLLTSQEKLEKSEKDLEKSEQTLALREEQLRILSESLQKSERNRQLVVKIGVPAVIIVVAGAFVGGLYAGMSIHPP